MSAPRRPLDQAISAVAGFLVADAPLGATLTRVAELARDAIGPAAGVGITLLDEKRRPHTSIRTPEIDPEVDEGQYEDDTGPCLDAYRERRTVRVDDTAAEAATWPRFSERAVAHGIRSTLSVPLTAGDQTIGAFNLYAKAPAAFGEQDQADAELFATQAAVVLANAQAYWHVVDLAGGLRSALESRAAIEQAKGMLMGTRHCTPEEAFGILVQASQRTNVKLRELATRVVASAQSDGRRRAAPLD